MRQEDRFQAVLDGETRQDGFWAASGAAVGAVLPVNDAFNVESVTIGSSVLYCVPVSTGGGIMTPTGHLVCYDVTTAGTAPGDVPVDNEFGQSTVAVGLPTGLCMPSLTTPRPWSI